MFEIEAKVGISKNEYELLYKKLKKEAKSLGSKKSADSYYKAPKNTTIRIRKRSGKNTFDLKRRKAIYGVESNFEMHWKIKDEKGWGKLLKKTGIKKDIKKIKISELFELDSFSVELHHVKKLGYFLEIEKVVKEKANIKATKKELIQLFKVLGYFQRQFEKKPYLELLANV